ncbi:hypothetical protein HOP51_08585 [Halomonas sp. MCCC 1A11036]|uniref:Uncharacterized protein n=1 Tax=Billgrantia zhangzhouensis TaxID=2733481 RepID=A0ABS9AEN3_9GAMM|nr:hypothetical protein [Halomonas zhangzhouensis]MCE8020170.1 hypothetical protein [Halomonas zhangzhouensis]
MSSQQQTNEPTLALVHAADYYDALTLAKAYFEEADALFTAIRNEASSDNPDMSVIERLAGLGQRESDDNAGHYGNEADKLKMGLKEQGWST